MNTYSRTVTAYIPGKNPWTHRIRTFYDKKHTKKRTDGFAILIKGKLESHGAITTWHDNGHLIKIDNFCYGIQTGMTSMFRVDGTLFGQVTYKNGIKHGWTANYDKDGKTLLNQTMWLNNIRRRDYIYHSDVGGKKLIKEIVDYNNGKIVQKSAFDKDSSIATHQIFYENGIPHYIINEEKFITNNFKGSKVKQPSNKKIWALSGPLEIYYPDGTLKVRLFYNKGREDIMLRKEYNSSGKPMAYTKPMMFKIPNYTDILKPIQLE